MKWVLFLMFFSTPAANVTGNDATCLKHGSVTEIDQILDCRKQFEAHHVWSLQTTTQMEFSSFVGCFGKLDALIADTNVASTMTMRAWCMCDDPDSKKCPQDDDEAIGKFVDALRSCEINVSDPNCRAYVSDEVDKYIAKIKPPEPTPPSEKHLELVLPRQPQPAKPGTSSSSIRAYPRPSQN